MRFGNIPKEPPVERRLELLAPRMVVAVKATLEELEGGSVEWPFETLRSDERAAYLYGFGRLYDDGRGKVTNAPNGKYTWHRYGLAIDVVEKDATPWNAPSTFWMQLGEAAERNGLTWGGRWHHPDLPHLQWGGCQKSPSEEDWHLLQTEGIDAVWALYGATNG